MLGVVLLSEYNEMIHAFGNGEFRQHFFGHHDQQRAYSEGRGQVSSSSGVCSSPLSSPSLSSQPFANDPLSLVPNTDNIENATTTTIGAYQQNNVTDADHEKSHHKIPDECGDLLDESLLLQQLMPLVALCRTKNQSNIIGQQEIQCIQAGNTLNVRISTLSFSNLLVLIVAQSSLLSNQSSRRLFNTLLRCIDFHYGPQLQLIPLAFSPMVQQLHKRCEYRMLSILYAKEEKDKILLDSNKGDSQDTKNVKSPPICFEETGNPNVVQYENGKTFIDAYNSKATEDIVDEEFSTFCQNILFGGTQRFVQWALIPKFRELTKLIAQRIGRRCRCFFLHSDRLIASISSHSPSEKTLSCISRTELQSILQFAQKLDPSDETFGLKQQQFDVQQKLSFLPKFHTEQTWLYSKTLRRLQLHNVFLMSLNSHTMVATIALAEQYQLIGHINNALEFLEKIDCEYIDTAYYKKDDGEHLNKLIDKCQQHLDCARKLLYTTFDPQNLQRMGAGLLLLLHNTQWDYLDDVQRTCEFINQLWNHFSVSIHMYIQQSSSLTSSSSVLELEELYASSQTLLFHDDYSNSIQQQHSYCQPTISSIYSTAGEEWRSSIHASFSTSTRYFTSQLESLKTQLKKLLRAILLELIVLSSGLARSQTLQLLHVTIRHQMAQHHLAKTLEVFEDEIARRWVQGNPLRPACLQLDAFAYCFIHAGTAPLHFYYTTDKEKELFTKVIDAFTANFELPVLDGGSDAVEEMMVAKTSDGKLILQLSGNSNDVTEGMTHNQCGDHKLLPKFLCDLSKKIGANRKSTVRRNNVKPKPIESTSYQYHCVVLFPCHINISLAMRQAQTMIEILVREMDKCQMSFY